MNNELDSEIPALRNQLFYLLIALIVLSTTVAAYLFREASQSGKELAEEQRIINNYNEGVPAIMAFANQLGAYGMTHPDIRPLLAKYGIAVAPTQPGTTARPPGR